MTGSHVSATFCMVDAEAGRHAIAGSSAARRSQLKRAGARARGRPRARPRRPRAGPGVGSAVEKPVLELVARPASARARRWLGVPLHPAEELGRGRDRADAAARRPRAAARRARARRGCCRAAPWRAIGPTRCVPQRSCSLPAAAPCS